MAGDVRDGECDLAVRWALRVFGQDWTRRRQAFTLCLAVRDQEGLGLASLVDSRNNGGSPEPS
jgi:hypothetical protein